MNKPTEPINAWLKPLRELCAVANVTATPDLIQAYHRVLGHLDPKVFAAVVLRHTQTEQDTRMPAPAKLLALYRQMQAEAMRIACAMAEPCAVCGMSGLVTARVAGEEAWKAYACGCVRGRQYTGHAPFDPETMEEFQSMKRRLAEETPVKRSFHLPSAVKRIGAMPANTK